MTDKERCVWCTAPNGKTDITFAVIDDDLGQYVKGELIKYCPFCGKELEDNER